jgi:hypothetical protein
MPTLTRYNSFKNLKKANSLNKDFGQGSSKQKAELTAFFSLLLQKEKNGIKQKEGKVNRSITDYILDVCKALNGQGVRL